MLATIRDDTYNVLNMQHITPDSERWDCSDIPSCGNKIIKGPAHVVEGGHHLRKVTNPHPSFAAPEAAISAAIDEPFVKT